MGLAKRWRRLLGSLFGGVAVIDGSKASTTAQVAQVLVEPVLSVAGTTHIGQVLVEPQLSVASTTRIGQVVVEPQWQADTTNVRVGQVIIEVLRTAHCVIVPPVLPPQSVCPPVDFTGTATGGCVAAVDPL